MPECELETMSPDQALPPDMIRDRRAIISSIEVLFTKKLHHKSFSHQYDTQQNWNDWFEGSY